MHRIRGGRATCTLLRLRCGVPPRQTQTDNDASGSSQHVAGRPPEYPPGRPLRNRIQAMGITKSQVTKNTANGHVCRGRPLTSQTAFGGQLPYKGSLVRPAAIFGHSQSEYNGKVLRATNNEPLFFDEPRVTRGDVVILSLLPRSGI